MHETFSHTADLGIRARAADLSELFAEMGRALRLVTIEAPENVRAESGRDLPALRAADLEVLLLDFLGELLYAFDAEGFMPARYTIAVTETTPSVEGTLVGEIFDAQRHGAGTEVKAVTYHDLSVERDAQGGWRAEAILDI